MVDHRELEFRVHSPMAEASNESSIRTSGSSHSGSRSNPARTWVLLHGGPGAPGHMASLARLLLQRLPAEQQPVRVLEPFQRRSSPGDALSVAAHVADLHHFLALHQTSDESPMALVGSSWGAMLALAYATAYPNRHQPLALIGCGTFDLAARAELIRRSQLRATEGRATSVVTPRPPSKPQTEEQVLAAMAREHMSQDIVSPCAPIAQLLDQAELERVDARGHTETWSDVLRLQTEALHPQSFARISNPVAMFHGERDRHPGGMIRDNLREYLPELRYFEYPHCGHYPWLERSVRETFATDLQAWLAKQP